MKQSRAAAAAEWFLRTLGVADAAPPDDVVIEGADVDEPSLPRGTFEYATGLAVAGARLLARLGGTPVEVSTAVVRGHVLLPAVAAAAGRSRLWARPPAPRPVSKGAVHADLGGEGDAEAFERLLLTLGPSSAARVARWAQVWRLPVLPYAKRPTEPAGRTVVQGFEGISPSRAPSHGAPLRGIVVCDLTSIWAGPLATSLLRDAGADVVKVEADVRPDGLRVGDPAMFEVLNAGKRTARIDLRTERGARKMRELVAGADVVIDSFSPRVMPNLGLDHRSLGLINPDVISVSMPAFPRGSRRRSWVAYGSGIHASTGLGDAGDGRFWSAPVSYPDPLSGLATFAAVAAALLDGRSRHIEVPLESVTLPLLRFPRRAPSEIDPAIGKKLLAEIGSLPRSPFRAAALASV